MNYKEYDEKPKKLNRFEVFSLGVSTHKKTLFLLGLLLSLSLVAVVTFRFLIILHKSEMNLALLEETVTQKEVFNSLSSVKNMFYIACFPLIIPAALIFAGITKVSKIISWRDKTSLKDDFTEGMRENGFITVTVALLNVAMMWCVYFVTAANEGFTVWKYLPAAVYFLLVIPLSMWTLAATAIYKGGFILTVKNAFALTVKTYPSTILAVIIMMLPLLALLIPWIYIQLIIPFVFAVYLPFAWSAWAIFTNAYFDKYINKTQFPHLVDKGLN